MFTGLVDQVHYAVGGMLPAKQPLLDPGRIKGPGRRARIV